MINILVRSSLEKGIGKDQLNIGYISVNPNQYHETIIRAEITCKKPPSWKSTPS